jgi:hypothetical protein
MSNKFNLWNFYSHRFRKEPIYNLYVYNILKFNHAVLLPPDLISEILPPINEANLKHLKKIKNNPQSCERILNVIRIVLQLYGFKYGHSENNNQPININTLIYDINYNNFNDRPSFYLVENYNIYLQNIFVSHKFDYYIQLLNNIIMYIIAFDFSYLTNDITLLLENLIEYTKVGHKFADAQYKDKVKNYLSYIDKVQEKFKGILENSSKKINKINKKNKQNKQNNKQLSLAAKFVLTINLLNMILTPVKGYVPKVVFPTGTPTGTSQYSASKFTNQKTNFRIA